jgi:hypothetical protein
MLRRSAVQQWNDHEEAMDVYERWRLASDSADRFSRFRRRQPLSVGLSAAAVAALTLTLFLGLAELNLKHDWGAALMTVAAIMFVGYISALLCNHRAKSAYVAEHHRMNKT